MNPEVASAVDELERRGILTAEQAMLPRRVARGELLSVRGELGVLLYAGVSLVVAGAGLLVKQNLDAIGPLGIALGIGAAALLALAWVARKAPRFTWGEAPSPHLALEYVLLLGLLLIGADLAFIEVKFTPLGADWPWHFFIISLVALVLAVRYDSRVAFSLALCSFAAWRGVSVSFVEWRWYWVSSEVVRFNMIVCGIAFLGLGALLVRAQRKAHFEPVATYMGWLLVVGAFFQGMCQVYPPSGRLDAMVLLLMGAGLALWMLRKERFWLFAIGVVGAYAGLSGLILRTVPGGGLTFASGWFALSALGVLAILVRGHRAMKRREP